MADSVDGNGKVLDPRDKIAEIIVEAERSAYQRGWNDACAAIRESVDHHLRHDTGPANEVAPQPKGRRGRPPSKALEVIRDCISATPGMRVVEIVKAAQLADANVKEPTVRTYLRRLKQSKIIWQRTGRWYPAQERAELDNGFREAPKVSH